LIGEKIAHFTILEKLGSGGMGVVYKATDTKLRTTVALKFLAPELTRDDAARKRLQREAQALAALDHPNICTIHSIHDAPDGRIFFCMAYYEGETLEKKLSRGPFAVREAVRIVQAAADGLGKAHSMGVVHRDLKPGNIMITTDGAVKLLDFGIAKLAARSRVTRVGVTPGTLHYMSPEQITGDDVDERSDVFALGVILYEMLSGHVPFEGDHRDAVAYQIIHQPAQPMARYRSDVPKGLQRVLDRALEKEADARYPRAADFKRDIESAMGSRLPRPGIRRWIGLAAAAAAVIAAWMAADHQRGRAPTEKRVWLLPFTTTSGDPSHRAMLDGLHETLTGQLILLDGFDSRLWVLSSRDARSRHVDAPAEAAGLLGVNTLISGTLQLTSTMTTFELSLIDADDQRILETIVVDSPWDSLGAWQVKLAAGASSMLGRTLSDEAKAAIGAGTTTLDAAYIDYLEGYGFLQQPDHITEAIARFERALQRDPKYVLAHVALARARARNYQATGNSHDSTMAFEHCRQAFAIDTLVVDAYLGLGEVCAVTGRNEGAVEAFQRALAIAPTSAAYRGLATAYETLGETEAEEATLKSVIARHPDFWPVRENLAYYVYYPLARYSDAAAQYEAIVRATPRYHEAYSTLGAYYYYLGRMDDAERMWQKSFGIKKSYRACTNLGTLYYRAKRYPDAARMYEWAAEFDDLEVDFMVWGNLAQAYSQIPEEKHKTRENYDKAIAIAKQQRQKNPTDPLPPAFLGGYYADIGDTLQSRARIEEAVKIAPTNSEVLFRAGHAYAKLGDHERALVWLGKAIENGWGIEEIMEDPELQDLREDPRFKLLVNGRE
jgi:serine/threonine-protein kinase